MKQSVLAAFLLAPLLLVSQSYDAALGIRVGTEWGATAQLRLPQIHKNFVLEGIVLSSLNEDEGTLTLLGKQHQPLLSRRLNLFYGAGVHAGWSNEIDGETGNPFDGPKGITGIVGMEATFARVNVSYDFKPALNVVGGESVLDTHTAVSVRYVIGKRYSIWNRDKEKEIRKRRRAKDRERRREERDRAGKRWFQVWKSGN
ncbi:hypothetical protein GGR26_001309 [Lewinella marina]|uniref:Outer membrane protein beta-barrel domain-containing protein n=1 Tax=Neolewinella marina TaxID=438751 RepID=A0A2G0CFR3_9BACT|nr:hypothetical protein [Neolewinella marina]NJB85564.1 hypothetical protein [Neolewinella marina]PHK98750.1 hypothetical protein CGL56_09810 [Neolewinella marina]